MNIVGSRGVVYLSVGSVAARPGGLRRLWLGVEKSVLISDMFSIHIDKTVHQNIVQLIN